METVCVLAFFAPVVAWLRRAFARGWAFSVSGSMCPPCCVSLGVESARERERKAAQEREGERRAGPPKCPTCGADLSPWEVEGEPCDRCADGGRS